MELADLVRPVTKGRVLLHCLVLGAALHGLRILRSEPAARPQVPLEVWAEDEASIREAVLVDYALRGGALERDQVLRERLMRNARFLRLEGEPVEAAVALGLHRTDPVARARLRWLGEELLLSQTPLEPPDEETLEAFMTAHRARYERPATVAFRQVLLSRQKRGDDLDRDAATARAQLAAGAAPAVVGDATSLPAALPPTSARRIDALFGVGFAASLAAPPEDTWAGPVRSSFGLHLVRIEARRDASLPPLDEVRARVEGDWRDAQRSARLTRAVDRLRAGYDIRVPAPSRADGGDA